MSAAYPHAPDLSLIPCELSAARDRGSFELTPGLCRFDGAFYGGTGFSARPVAMARRCASQARSR